MKYLIITFILSISTYSMSQWDYRNMIDNQETYKLATNTSPNGTLVVSRGYEEVFLMLIDSNTVLNSNSTTILFCYVSEGKTQVKQGVINNLGIELIISDKLDKEPYLDLFCQAKSLTIILLDNNNYHIKTYSFDMVNTLDMIKFITQ